MPVVDASVDVVISNCVLNLVPNKDKAFQEIKRVLKPTGHFSVSDIVLNGELPTKLRVAAEMYAGCVAGASKIEDYLDHIRAQGFEQIEIKKEKKIYLPDSILENYLGSSELSKFKESETGIFSITVVGKKL